jgi:hypothetical protein
MAHYPIFIQVGGGGRIAINPEWVVSIVEIDRDRVAVNLPDGGSATIAMSLENVIAQLRGASLSPGSSDTDQP